MCCNFWNNVGPCSEERLEGPAGNICVVIFGTVGPCSEERLEGPAGNICVVIFVLLLYKDLTNSCFIGLYLGASVHKWCN